MVAVGGSYNVTKSVGSLAGGNTVQITFDPINFNVNVTQNLKVYVNWSTDQNHSNDTLYQPTIYYPGVNRKVLFEAFTSSTCGPCASQNPALDAFVQARFDTIVAIKTHVWWPALGDPMYGLNIPQARIRTLYNSISAVPCLQIDGVIQQVSNYTTLSNLLNPYNARLAKASPISISVADTRLTGDTIKATVTMQVVSPISSSTNYRMKVAAVERKITYSTPPGSNGETIFYDVFRRMFPSTDGMSINITPGTYTYIFKYKRESTWVDSMMYTAVFIQNENTHEVINCAKARNYYADDKIAVVNNSSVLDSKFFTPVFNYSPLLLDGGITVETMEGAIPPSGWSIINADSNFTFWQYLYSAINGPSFGGSKSIRINYYSYAENVGTIDILRSKVYNNVSPDDSLKFDYAYAVKPGYTDRLKVKLSTDGGNTFPYTIFDRAGSVLATAPDNSASFVPTAGQWGTFGVRVANVTSINPPLTGGIPMKYELNQNYPNPFNPSTTISFSLPAKAYVTLIVYDILGKEMTTLFKGEKTAGVNIIEFDASNLPSGIYFYRIEANGFTDTKKMLLIK
jgi:thiol-disulfide isomerase/thioredoxin